MKLVVHFKEICAEIYKLSTTIFFEVLLGKKCVFPVASAHCSLVRWLPNLRIASLFFTQILVKENEEWS